MAWYFPLSVHDTHDWDATETPVLIDGVINGRQRKLVSTAQRNGYFYTLDRVTGEHIVTAKYGTTTNWAKSMRANGVVDPNPLKEATIPGSLVSPVESGVTNWPPAAYSPETGLFYIPEHNGFNLLYLTDPDPRGSMGLGGKSVSVVGSAGDFLTAIDYKTGRVAWRKPISGGGVGAGLLATAGGLLVCRRRKRQFHGARFKRREAAVAYAYRQRLQCARDISGRWTAACSDRGRRHAVRVYPLLKPDVFCRDGP